MLHITSKSGKKLSLKPPELADAAKLLEFINAQVDENTKILLDQHKTLADEIEYINDSRSKIEAKEKVQFLAWDENTLVANAEINKLNYKASHVGRLGISIAKAYRGDGVGSQLLEILIKEAETDLEIKLIKLEVLATNHPARALYQKLGFVEFGRLPKAMKHAGQYVDEVLMYLELN